MPSAHVALKSPHWLYPRSNTDLSLKCMIYYKQYNDVKFYSGHTKEICYVKDG